MYAQSRVIDYRWCIRANQGAEVVEHQIGAAACGPGQRGRQLVGKGACHGGLLGGQGEADGRVVHAFYGYQGVEGGVVGTRGGRAREGGLAAVDGFGIDHQLLIRSATVPQGYLVAFGPVHIKSVQLCACLRHIGSKSHVHGFSFDRVFYSGFCKFFVVAGCHQHCCDCQCQDTYCFHKALPF